MRRLRQMGYVESALDPCLMLLPARSGPLKLDGVVLLDVDDFLQGGTAWHHQCMEELRMELKFGKWKQHRGEFLGRTVTQLQSFEIQVCMKLLCDRKEVGSSDNQGPSSRDYHQMRL